MRGHWYASAVAGTPQPALAPKGAGFFTRAGLPPASSIITVQHDN